MSPQQLALILISVSMTTLAQFLLKVGASSSGFVAATNTAASLDWLLAVLRSPAIIAGFVFYAASALLWLIVLKQVDVSVAYPFVGLGFIATMVLGALVLGEPVGLMRIIGTLMIAAGVGLVAKSA